MHEKIDFSGVLERHRTIKDLKKHFEGLNMGQEELKFSNIDKDFMIEFLFNKVMELDKTVNGDGQPGIKADLGDFLAKWKAREEDRKIYDDRQQNERRDLYQKITHLIALGVFVLALIGTSIAVYSWWHRYDGSENKIKKVSELKVDNKSYDSFDYEYGCGDYSRRTEG